MYRSIQFPVLSVHVFPFLIILTLTCQLHGKPPPVSLPLPSHVLYQFPSRTWVENIAVRSSGEILVTLLSTPDVYLIDHNSPHPTAQLVHSIPFVLGVFGIAELEHDVFYVAAGNLSIFTSVNTPESYSVWEIDMRSFAQSGARVRKVTNVPEAVLFNGVVTLSKEDSTILIADSDLGVVWKVNVTSGAYSIAISDPVMSPSPTAEVQIGINGVKIRGSHLYFTNSNRGLFGCIPISTSGLATGAAKVLATGLDPDDFDLDSQGRAWITQNTRNVVSVVLGNGTVVDVVGAVDQLTVAGATSCLFGSRADGAILYCTTAGGLALPVNGTVIEGGKVVVIDTEGLSDEVWRSPEL